MVTLEFSKLNFTIDIYPFWLQKSVTLYDKDTPTSASPADSENSSWPGSDVTVAASQEIPVRPGPPPQAAAMTLSHAEHLMVPSTVVVPEPELELTGIVPPLLPLYQRARCAANRTASVPAPALPPSRYLSPHQTRR